MIYLDIVRDTSYINYRPLKNKNFWVKIWENCFIHSIKKYQLFIFKDQSTDFSPSYQVFAKYTPPVCGCSQSFLVFYDKRGTGTPSESATDSQISKK
jgi:hypothetical protein